MNNMHLITIRLLVGATMLMAVELRAEPAPVAKQQAAPAAAALRIEAPGERSIFQRDKKNKGRVPVRCTSDEDAVEVRALDKTSRDEVKEWTALKAVKGSFTAVLDLPAGWYELEFRVTQGGQAVQTATLQRVGVGDVFVTAGQSNSANYGQPRQAAKADCVSTCDFQTGQWRHADDPQPGASGGGGSPWPLLGDLLTGKTGLPVGFICVGVGSTRVSQWAPTGDCYPRLKKALEIAGPNGCRAVLWHQGESDSMIGTPPAIYAQTLAQAINQSRGDAKWQVPWGVALASYHPAAQSTADRQQAVVAGQQQVIKGVRGVFQGPVTDGFLAKGFLSDTVHFNAEGLKAHAEGWFEALR
jgi:hypothetical protein